MELRNECFKCKYKDKCYHEAVYDSIYCKAHRFYKMSTELEKSKKGDK